jgi:hypothetical protein
MQEKNATKPPSAPQQQQSPPPAMHSMPPTPNPGYGNNMPWQQMQGPPAAMQGPPPGVMMGGGFASGMGGPPPGVMGGGGGGGMPPAVAQMLASMGGGAPGAMPFNPASFAAMKTEKQLTKRSTQLKGLSQTFKTVQDPIEAAKMVKYQRTTPKNTILSPLPVLTLFRMDSCSCLFRIWFLNVGGSSHSRGSPRNGRVAANSGIRQRRRNVLCRRASYYSS